MSSTLFNFTNPEIKSHLYKMAIIGLLLIVVTSIFSIGFYYVDEHFQIIEFVSYKLNLTPSSFLAWEYEYKMRPWLQPAFYYQIAKAMIGLGINDPFAWAMMFRLVTGLMSWVTLVFVSFWVINNIKNLLLVKWFIPIIFTLGFIPYLSVRTSSETFSLIFLTLGFLSTTISDKMAFSKVKWLMIGFFFGLSIGVRYQAGFGVLGFLFWLVFFYKSKFTPLWQIFIGLALPLLLGLWVDYWGYNEWTLTPWNYFKKNIMGDVNPFVGFSYPFWYYPILMLYHPLSLINILLFIGVFVFWWRFFKHPITWITLFFFLSHSFLEHKEIRFLFPIILLSLMGCFLTCDFILHSHTYLAMRLKQLYFSKFFWFLICFNYLTIAFFSFASTNYEINTQKAIYQKVADFPIYVYGRSPYDRVGGLKYRFYAPKKYSESPIKSLSEINELEFNYIIADNIPKAEAVIKAYPQAQLVYRSLPAWVIKFNYFDWVSRTKIWSLFRLNN